MSIVKKDVQDFLKRLRYYEKDVKIRYYAVGEYGTNSYRPHYHIILFNASDDNVYKAWTKGGIHIGTVGGASIGYTLKYMSKEKMVPKHRNDDRVPEFSLMSKGMGMQYVTEAMISWHRADLLNRMYVPMLGGKKMHMPRVYKKYFYTEDEREEIISHIIDEDNKIVHNYELEHSEKLHKAAMLQKKRKGGKI